MVAQTWTKTRRRKGGSAFGAASCGCCGPSCAANKPHRFKSLRASRVVKLEAKSDQQANENARSERQDVMCVSLNRCPEQEASRAGSRLMPNPGRPRRARFAADSLLRECMILIGIAALLAPTSLPAQEIGEGLTLSHKFAGAGQQQLKQRPQQHQHQLTADDVSRIKAENRVSAQLGQNVILNCPVQFKDGRERLYALEWLKHPQKLPIYLWHAGYPDHKAAGYESRVQRLGLASLNLSQVRETDQGLYECHIYYLDERPDDAAKPTRLYLDVLAPPRITIEPAPMSYVQAGDSLHLTCRAESMPAPVLRWYKNKQPIDSNSGAYRTSSVIVDPEEDSSTGSRDASDDSALEMQRQASQEDLFIDNIQAGQGTGDYRCLASNSEGSVEAHAQVILGVPAVITGTPRDQLRLEGERAEFVCQAKALPSNITYAWFFNDKPIQQLRWFDSRHAVRRDGTLILPSVHRDDQGNYKCQASNGLSHRSAGAASAVQIAEASASLTVEFPARVTQSPSPQYLPLGLSGLVRCFVQAVPPVEFFTWTLNNQQFDAAADPNIERLLNGSLLIKQVTRSYRGTYRCTPFNKHGTAGSSGAMEVRVEEPPVFVMRPAEFYKAAAGGHVSIACEARGEPPPAVSWRRVVGRADGPGSGYGGPAQQHMGSARAPPPAKVSSMNELELPPLQPNDEPDSDEHDLYVRSADESPPGEKQSVIVYAPPPAERSDYKNSHLLLHGLRKEDHGRYECVIENEVATLVASTMLYIEETSPHAPTNVQVETKRWSAVVSWTPGYDGGFEQSFTVWYRQVGSQHQQAAGTTGASDGSAASRSAASQPTDFNWRSASVRPPDATSLEVHNLTHNTAYEFCVHAKNIIGEGPRSPVVLAVTKRAVLSQLGGPTTQDEAKLEDADHASGQSTMNPAILGIIHLVDYTTTEPHNVGGASSTSQQQQQQQQQAESASDTFLQLYPTVPHTQEPPSTAVNSSSSSKVIKIILPNQPHLNSTSSSSSQNPENQSTSKRSRPNDPTGHNQPQDSLTAPHSLKMTKVAQGWVLSWSAPPIASTFGHLSDATSTVAASQVLTDGQRPASGAGPVYLIEYREKGGAWHTVPVPQSQERSMLLKDLKLGAEYLFRVYAADSYGQKGAASHELSQTIPDYRRKPVGGQALSAGVVSGMLFFIACIVIAVCTVNMCNKRRKKRAEKAAYVMMACPVLESHHDIEALNTNSLMKNTGGPQNRVSSVRGHPGVARNDRKFIDKLGRSLSRIGKRLFRDDEPPPPPPPPRELHRPPESPTRCIRYSASRPALPVDVGDAPLEPPGRATTPSDDYWLLEPADSKWGTLTVATSRLAERRAREAAARRNEAAHTTGRITSRSTQVSSSSSAAAPAVAAPPVEDNNLQLQSQLLFESWLAKQLSGERERGAPEAIPGSAQAGPSPAQLEGGGGAPPALLQHPPGQAPANWHTGHSASFTYQRQQTPGWHHFQLQPPTSCGPTLLLHPAHGAATLQTMLVQRRANSSYLATAANGHQHYDQHYDHHHHQWLNQCWAARQQQQFIKPEDQVAPRQLALAPHAARLGRNSIARRTLPLTAINFMGQQLVHQATHYHHKSPAAPAAHHQQQQRQLYLASQHQLPLADLQQHDIPAPVASCITVTSQDDGGPAAGDDPLTDNACFGSYKRKRRLPHIEAQFTITPPQPHPRHLAAHQRPGGQRCVASEREALESGHLFVRPTSAPGPRGVPRRAPPPPPPDPLAGAPAPPPPAPTPPLPPGMPSSGQRTEQRRLRAYPLPQVATIGAQEKIETYLRHYDQAQREPLDLLLLDGGGGGGGSDYEGSREESADRLARPAGQSAAARVVQTTEQELIFQPYSNLPSLKYTISLPLGHTLDGSIVLGETNQLRLSKRSSRKRRLRTLSAGGGGATAGSNSCGAPPDAAAADLAAILAANKQRLGSSSSCPPGGPQSHLTKDLPPIKRRHEISKHSLESCLRYNQPLPGKPLLEFRTPVDSLESVAEATKKHHTKSQPFYLAHFQPPTEPQLAPPPPPSPPPPVPPHRNTCQQASPEPAQVGRADRERRLDPSGGNPAAVDSQLAFIQKNSESSNSPQSSSSPQPANLSPSSSEATHQENQSENENCGATSEVPTNSVDENYEFDQLSSSSSSIHLRRKAAKGLVREARAVLQVSTTTTTNEQPPPTQANNDKLTRCHGQLVATERSNLTDYSRCKLFPLTSRVEVGATSGDLHHTTNYYDTVYGDTLETAKSAASAQQ